MLQRDAKELLRWYDRCKRPLPWRRTTDPYAVLVSEIMLQQTTVAAVIPKYEQWMARFPDVEQLARSEADEVMRYWSGLGYYQRARRLRQAAEAVCELGGFPLDYDGLLKLPGVGPYTAAAVASICHRQPVLAVDTNVIRVLFRYYGLPAPGTDRKALKELHSHIREVWDWAEPGDLNQAMMELGASLCSIRAPKCRECPVRRGCRARASEGGPEGYPLPGEKKRAKTTSGRALVLREMGTEHVLTVQGTTLGLLAELHQPPLLFAESAAPWEDRLLHALGHLGCSEPMQSGHLKYSISGRRLELEVGLWELHSEAIAEIMSLLKEEGLRPALYQPGQERSVPISTLTRKALKTVWGSPSIAPLRDKKN